MKRKKLFGKIRHKFKPRETVWVFEGTAIYQAKVVKLVDMTNYGRTMYQVQPTSGRRKKQLVWGLQMRRPHHDH